MKFLIILLAALLDANLADAQHTYGLTFTKDYVTAGELVDWFICDAQGNYPDGRTCDHFISCTANLDAYQMPCADRDAEGNRLHYVPTSGPNEQASYCDWPNLVECSINPTTAQPPVTVSDPPEDVSDPPAEEGDCDGVKPGDSCNEAVDCHQCGYCDKYLRCDKDTWVQLPCQSKPEADGTIRVSKKLFWNRGGNVHGGTCVPWVNLKPSLQDEYRQDPKCKQICDFRKENTCDRKYYFVDPDFNQGIWSAPEVALSCAAQTKWVNAERSCVWCGDGECTKGC